MNRVRGFWWALNMTILATQARIPNLPSLIACANRTCFPQSGNREAAVHRQYVTGRRTRFIGGQRQNRVRHIDRIDEPKQVRVRQFLWNAIRFDGLRTRLVVVPAAATALIRTLCCANSTAMERVKAEIAPLAAV